MFSSDFLSESTSHADKVISHACHFHGRQQMHSLLETNSLPLSITPLKSIIEGLCVRLRERRPKGTGNGSCAHGARRLTPTPCPLQGRGIEKIWPEFRRVKVLSCIYTVMILGEIFMCTEASRCIKEQLLTSILVF